MPIHRTSGGGWQWGQHGHVYASRAGAERQAAAAHANGYAGDVAGWVENNHERDEKGQFVTAYHGTGSNNLESILKNGIRPGKTAPGVFLSTSHNTAHWFAKHNNTNGTRSGAQATVLKLRIPAAEYKKYKQDPAMRESAAVHTAGRSIPPEWITAHKIHSHKDEPKRPAIAGDEIPRAAGVMCEDPDGRVLFLRRAAGSDHAGTWCFPGGGAEDGEEPEDTAWRELVEETAYSGQRDGAGLGPVHAARSPVNFHTFGMRTQPFLPRLNDEHDGFAWAHPSAAPQPLHPGVSAMLDDLAQAQAQAQDAAKVSKASVRYGEGKGDDICANCAHYMRSTCELVAGAIEPGYWCELFTPAGRYAWRDGDIEILETGSKPAPLPDEDDEDYVDEVTEPVATLHVYPEEQDA